MHIIGLDIGKRNSQLCVGTPEGRIIRQVRVTTTKEALTEAVGPFLPAKALIEASTSSEWVARHLETLGVDVVVGDPRFGPMYAQAEKHIKTDKRDAAALFHARRLGAYRAANRRTEESRLLRKQLAARAMLVRMRGRLVVQMRSFLEEEGIKIKSCAVETFPAALAATTLPEHLGTLLLPLVAAMEALDVQVNELDRALDAAAQRAHIVRRFDKVAGVGPVTALAVVAAIGDPARFASARGVAAYLGLVPREYSSGEGRRQGTITKAGDSLTRCYLVQAAWRLLRSKSQDAAPLREWALRVAERRGRRRAVVALARRLVRILFAMWRDDRDFDVARLLRT